MKNDTPILLDRIDQALKSHGVTLKRNQLLSVASEAFGYRNANAFSAAAKKGEIAPPKAEPIGNDDYGLTVFRDPLTGSMFAMDADNQASRAQHWAVSPYGGLIDISNIPIGTKIEDGAVKVYVATISHKHGSNFYVDFTSRGIEEQVSDFCREYWNEVRDHDDSLPENTGGMSDSEIISTYFDIHPDEYLDRSSEQVAFPLSLANKVQGEAWVIQTENEDGETLWWNNEDGWGAPITCATVFRNTEGRLPDAGIANEAKWIMLPSFDERKDGPKEDGLVASETPHASDRQQKASILLTENPIKIEDGLSFGLLKAEKGENQDELMLQTSGDYDPATAREWSETLRRKGEEVFKIQVRFEIQDKFARVWMPDDLYMSKDVTHWYAAVRDLLLPTDGRERIEAVFQPETWINDHAVPCDPQGDTVFDVTYEMIMMGFDAAEAIDSGNADFLTDALRAPRWISNWPGPFTITIKDIVNWEEKRHFFP